MLQNSFNWMNLGVIKNRIHFSFEFTDLFNNNKFFGATIFKDLKMLCHKPTLMKQIKKLKLSYL